MADRKDDNEQNENVENDKANDNSPVELDTNAWTTEYPPKPTDGKS